MFSNGKKGKDKIQDILNDFRKRDKVVKSVFLKGREMTRVILKRG